MDVKCEKCGTEYEFDDSKVTQAGITVKCTHCGHLFRVSRQRAPEQDESINLPPQLQNWRIRNVQGEIREFQELATLQEWIVQGKVSRSDEISKSGENWKPLGSIVELANFFLSAPNPPPPPGSSELLGSGDFRLEGPQQQLPESPSWSEPHFDLQSGSSPGIPALYTPSPLMTGQSAAISFPPQAPPHRGGSFLLGVFATLALVGVGYFVYDQFLRPPPQIGEQFEPTSPSPRLLARLRRANVAWQRDTEKGLGEAATAYTEVLAALGRPPAHPELAIRAHMGRARVAITQAEYELLEGRGAQNTLNQASLELEEAADSEGAELQLLYADFYRVSGELKAAERALHKAEEEGADPVELSFIRTALSFSGPAAPESAAQQLGQLSSEARSLPRARFLRVIALKRAEKHEEALQALTELLSLNPEHGPGTRLLKKFKQEKTAKTKAPKKKPDAGEPKVEKEGKPKKLSVDVLIRQGNTALENGRTSKARALFRKVVDRRPRSPEPWANLGWCDLADGRPSQALGYFERALRKSRRYADALFGKARALETAGRRAEAIEAYKEYLEQHPLGSKSHMIRRKLERLAP